MPSDLDIFACPSNPMMRRAGREQRLGLGKDRRFRLELGGPAPDDLAGEFEVLDLILTNRDHIGTVQRDIGGLEHGIIQQAGWNIFPGGSPYP